MGEVRRWFLIRSKTSGQLLAFEKVPFHNPPVEHEVIAKEDLQPIIDKMRAYYEDGSESGPQVIREFLEAWEGTNVVSKME